MADHPDSVLIYQTPERRPSQVMQFVWSFLRIVLLFIIIMSALILVLVIVAVSQHRAASTKASRMRTIADISLLSAALKQFEADNHRFPTTAEGLDALLTAPPGLAPTWNGPYIETPHPDGWGNPYTYRSPGKSSPFELLSAGADGAAGTADDIDVATAMSSIYQPPASPAPTTPAISSPPRPGQNRRP